MGIVQGVRPMNETFPSVRAISIEAAPAGSIVKIARYDRPLLALVTDSTKEEVRSIVILNSSDRNRPPVLFMGWRTQSPCLAFDCLHFELSEAEEDVSTGRPDWSDAAGTIVCI